MPLRSATAVGTMSTRESGSSGPVHGDLVDAQAGALGDHEQLRVEEPLVVLDPGQQRARPVGADGLEAALRVAEPAAQGRAGQEVVAAGDDLALGSAFYHGRAGQPGADREVRVPGDERRHQGQERAQVGGEVDVHVDEHGGVALRPRRLERSSAALLVQVQGRRRGPPVGETARRSPTCASVLALSAMVMRYEKGKRALEELEQAQDVAPQLGLLVVDGEHDVDDGRRGLGGLGRAGLGGGPRRAASSGPEAPAGGRMSSSEVMDSTIRARSGSSLSVVWGRGVTLAGASGRSGTPARRCYAAAMAATSSASRYVLAVDLGTSGAKVALIGDRRTRGVLGVRAGRAHRAAGRRRGAAAG